MTTSSAAGDLPAVPGHTHDVDLSAYATRAEVASMIQQAIPPVVAPPVVVPPVVVPVSTILGPGARAQSKGNVQSGGTDHQRQAIVFRAAKTGAMDTVQVSFRGEGGATKGYSLGTGGQHQFAVSDEFGNPVGSTGLYVPGNPSGAWTTYPRIGVGAPLTAGKLYRIEVDNIDPAPTTNFASLNHLFNWDGPPPSGRVQPRFPNTDWALMVSKGPGMGTVDPQHSPVCAIRYTDGTWQGLGYVGMIGGIAAMPGASVSYGVIGGNAKVRSTWAVTAPTPISTLFVGGLRCQTDGTLYITLRASTGDTDVIVPAGTIPISTPGGDNKGTVFAGGPLPGGQRLLVAGSYEVRLSSTTGKFSAAPIREGTEYGFDPGVAWPLGKFQITSDGTTWTDPYAGLDLQWYGEP